MGDTQSRTSRRQSVRCGVEFSVLDIAFVIIGPSDSIVRSDLLETNMTVFRRNWTTLGAINESCREPGSKGRGSGSGAGAGALTAWRCEGRRAENRREGSSGTVYSPALNTNSTAQSRICCPDVRMAGVRDSLCPSVSRAHALTTATTVCNSAPNGRQYGVKPGPADGTLCSLS